MQLVHVDDVVECLLEIVRQNLFPRVICEVGGSDTVTAEEFLRKVHRHYFKRNPAVIRIPMAIILPPLRFADRFFPSLLPVNAGQFAAFHNDGVVERNIMFDRCVPDPRGVDEIIGELAKGEEWDNRRSLERECEMFSRYLFGKSADEYVLRKYVEGNRVRGLVESTEEDRLGTALLRIASLSPFMTKLAASFAAVFAKRSRFRKKLVLLIAIIESSGSASDLIGPSAEIGTVGSWFFLIGQGIAFLASFVLSILLFLPLVILSKFGKYRPVR